MDDGREGSKDILESEYEALFLMRDLLALFREYQSKTYGSNGECTSSVYSMIESYLGKIESELTDSGIAEY